MNNRPPNFNFFLCANKENKIKNKQTSTVRSYLSRWMNDTPDF